MLTEEVKVSKYLLIIVKYHRKYYLRIFNDLKYQCFVMGMKCAKLYE